MWRDYFTVFGVITVLVVVVGALIGICSSRSPADCYVDLSEYEDEEESK
jgi:hypothetical protein